MRSVVCLWSPARSMRHHEHGSSPISVSPSPFLSAVLGPCNRGPPSPDAQVAVQGCVLRRRPEASSSSDCRRGITGERNPDLWEEVLRDDDNPQSLPLPRYSQVDKHRLVHSGDDVLTPRPPITQSLRACLSSTLMPARHLHSSPRAGGVSYRELSLGWEECEC
jgi:hypothetical protein